MAGRGLERALALGSALSLLAGVFTAVRVERSPAVPDGIDIQITIGGLAMSMLALAILCLVAYVGLRRNRRKSAATRP